MNTVKFVEGLDDTLAEAAETLKTSPEHLVEKTQEMTEQARKREKAIAELKQRVAGNLVDELEIREDLVDGVKTAIMAVADVDMEELRDMSDKLKDRMGSGIVVLGTKNGEKVNFLATATKDILKRGFHAGQLIKAVAAIAGGGGGGRPDMAQAGGKDPAKLGEALEKAEELIKNQLD